MGLWNILIPQNTISNINYCPNPSAERSATDYVAIGAATVGRKSAAGTIQPYSGGWMVEVASAAATDGVLCPPFTTASADPHSFFAFSLYAPSTAVVVAHIYTGGGAVSTDFATITGTGKWQRLAYGVGVQPATDAGLMFTSSDTFYIDALAYQLPANSGEYIELEYIDGDQPGCAWSEVPHNSYSIRDSQSRDGGRWYDLADYGLTVIQPGGIGMPPLFLDSQPRATRNGAEYTGQAQLPRVLSLAALEKGDSRPGLHGERSWLINAIKNDLVRGNQPFWLEYTGGDTPVRIQCVYNDGMQVSQFRGFSEDVILSLVAFDPEFVAPNNGAASLSASSTSGAANNIVRRNGPFRITDDYGSNITGMNDAIRALAFTADAELYGGGDFTDTAPTTSAFVNHLGKYNKIANTWEAAAAGVDNVVYSLFPIPDGRLLIGGAFTADGIANPLGFFGVLSGSVIGSLSGTDFNFQVNDIGFNQTNGEILAVGNFTTGGGVALDFAAKYSSSAWAKIGPTTDFNNNVWAVETDRNGNIYAGGEFTTAGAAGAAYYVAKLSSTGGDWVSLSASPSSDGGATVYDILEGPDGLIYACGSFTMIGGVAANYIACFDGTRWRSLGSGLNTTGYKLCFDSEGNLYCGGLMLTAGGRKALYFAIWNGSTWVPTGITVETTGAAISCYAIALDPANGDMYLGFDNVASSTHGATTSVTNMGTQKTKPVFHVYRTGGTSGFIRYINNLATRQKIFLNYPIQGGERVTIDTLSGSVTSTFKGRVTGTAILRGSAFGDFDLLPGANPITVFCEGVGAPTFEVYATWRNVYHSADGTSST